jgi:UDP-N-acetylglucosamine--N-acetylmuramyl-(pentapeptide) pyrophosphoryl-undecaprenol N-acetylglucosamine transferase
VLKKFKPEVVFSKGGYVGLPVTLAGAKLKIPVIVHESDVIPGLANKIAFRFADKICISFEETKKFIAERYWQKIILTGNPVRKSLLGGDQNKAYKITGFDKHRPVILVMGGSQGAMQINNLVDASLSELLKKFQIIHIRGRGNLDISLHKKGYIQYEYVDENLKDFYALSELVVSRGGANSLSEIAFLKKKALVIPLGTAGSRGDQIENAKVFTRKFGWGMLTEKVGSEEFVKAVELAYKNDSSGSEFKNGVEEIVKKIISVIPFRRK